MDYFLQLFVSGVLLGLVYGLVALGFAIIYKASAIVNLAQGEFVLIGAFLCWWLMHEFISVGWVAVIICLLVAVIIGLVLERLFLHPLVGESVLTVVMCTIALSALLRGATGLAWGYESRAMLPILPRGFVSLGTVQIDHQLILAPILCLIIGGAFYYFFAYSKAGLSMRAVAEDQQVARSAGVNVGTIFSVSWMIAAIVGAAGGLVLGSTTGVTPELSTLGLKCLPAVLLGGLESLPGAILGGIVIGITEVLGAGYLDRYLLDAGFLASCRDVIPFLAMVVILIVKPYGFFGLQRIERI